MMTAANVAAYAGQLALIVLACAGIPRLLRLTSPSVHYTFWRVLLVVCLALPFAQPWRAAGPAAGPAFAAAPELPPASTGVVSHAATPSPTLPPLPVHVTEIIAAVLIAGIVLRLGWIALGMARLRRMRKQATDAVLGFDDLRQAIGVTAPVLWSADVGHPVTFGVVRPVVLLPCALKAVDLPAQRAVIAHELHHVQRRDWAWVVGEEIVRSIFWFHPAMWWLISRVQLARETVVDELSILATNARRAYLDTLLAFADDTGLASSPAFSARRHLFHRVMLLAREGHMSSSRIVIASAVLAGVLAAGSWSAVRAFPLQSAAAQAQTPPRDPRPALHYHRQAVELWNKVMRDMSLTPVDKYDAIVKGIAAEDKALSIDPQYVEALTYKNILLRLQANMLSDQAQVRQILAEANELRDKAIALRRQQPYLPAAGEPTPPPPPPPPPSAAASETFTRRVAELQPVRIGGAVMSPLKLHDVKPEYPPLARASRVQGVVIAELLIDTDGRVVDARILRSIPLLDAAALDAVKQWEFQPTLLNGVPQNVMMTVTVNFSLE